MRCRRVGRLHSASRKTKNERKDAPDSPSLIATPTCSELYGVPSTHMPSLTVRTTVMGHLKRPGLLTQSATTNRPRHGASRSSLVTLDLPLLTLIYQENVSVGDRQRYDLDRASSRYTPDHLRFTIDACLGNYRFMHSLAPGASVDDPEVKKDVYDFGILFRDVSVPGDLCPAVLIRFTVAPWSLHLPKRPAC